MILYYKGQNKYYARKNRNQHAMTEAEGKIWNLVLREDKTWYRFLRQKLLWEYILDFHILLQKYTSYFWLKNM